MRTKDTEDASFSSWTASSTMGSHKDDVDTNMLSLSVIPHRDSIGLRNSQVTTQICVNVKAFDVDEEDRAAVDIIVALDVSGSMCGDKIKDCKQTLEFIVRTLKSTDRFGLITYSCNAKVLFPASKMNSDNKEAALQKIKTILADGMTNLSGGLAFAAQELNLIQDPNSIQSIFLLTDGHANVGLTRTEELKTLVRDFVATGPPAATMGGRARPPAATIGRRARNALAGMIKRLSLIERRNSQASLICFGYGSDHNSEMLPAISKETHGGAYYFINNGSESNVAYAFGEAIGGVLSVVAQGAMLTISEPPSAKESGVQIVKVHHDEAILREFGTYSVNINDFYAEESRDVLFAVQLSKVAHDNPFPHAQVTLSYFDVIRGKNCTVGPVACNISRPDNDELSSVNIHVEEQLTRIDTIEQINAAKAEADNGQFEAARYRLQGTVDRMRANMHLNTRFVDAMLKDVEEVTSGLQSRVTYKMTGHHTMENVSYIQTAQRSMATMRSTPDRMPHEVQGSMYQTKKRARKAQEFHRKSKGEE
jgi:von Willebrand factor type A domain